MNRLNRILIVILALQLVLAAAVLWPRGATTSAEGQSLFPDLNAEQIVEVTISDANGETIRLAKQADGWALPEAGDYSIEEDKVTPLLTKIAELQADRLVTQTSGSHQRLKVAEGDFERRVDLVLADGTRHQLYVGSSPSFGVAHVRAAGQDEVYLTSELSSQDAGTQATAWVDRIYFSLPQDQVVGLTLENSNGRFEFEKEGDTWTLKDLAAGEVLDEASVQTLISRAASMAMLQPLGKEDLIEYGMQEPSATVLLQTQSEGEDAKTYTLRVGAKDPDDNSYVVTSLESPYFVRVADFAVKDLVEKGRNDFLELPPTPTPLPEATPQS